MKFEKPIVVDARNNLGPDLSRSRPQEPEPVKQDALKAIEDISESLMNDAEQAAKLLRTLLDTVESLARDRDALQAEKEAYRIATEKTLKQALEAESSLATHERIEQRLRMEWWLGHGCSLHMLYGDDGEMQCSSPTCIRDFRREPIEALQEHVEARRMAIARAALTSGDLP